MKKGEKRKVKIVGWRLRWSRKRKISGGRFVRPRKKKWVPIYREVK